MLSEVQESIKRMASEVSRDGKPLFTQQGIARSHNVSVGQVQRVLRKQDANRTH